MALKSKFEEKVIRFCKRENYEHLNRFLEKHEYLYDYPSEDLLNFIVKFYPDSMMKKYIMDLVASSYKWEHQFSSIITLSLLNDSEVTIPLMVEYGDLSDEIEGKWLLEYLFDKKRFDLIDAVISNKQTDILELLITYKYYSSNNPSVVEYVENKLNEYRLSNNSVTFEKVVISCENTNIYYLDSVDIESILINGVSIDDFVKQNTTFIEKIEIVSSKNFALYENDDFAYPDHFEFNINSAQSISLYFTNMPARHYRLFWLSDSWYYDLLQRHKKENNKYYWSYDNTNISNNYFNFVGLEERVKYMKALPHNYRLSSEDIQDISKIHTACGSKCLYKNISDLVSDLKMIPNLDEVDIAIDELSPKEHDVLALSELTNLKQISFKIESGEISICNLEKLARSGLTVVLGVTYVGLFSLDENEFKRLQEIYDKAGAKLCTE